MKEEIKVYKYGGKMWLKVIKEIKEPDYSAKLFEENIRDNAWLLDHYVYFRPWDYCFNAELFGDSLKATGRNMIEYGDGVNSIKDGRRALYAGNLMSKLYGYNSGHEETWLDRVMEYKIVGNQFVRISSITTDHLDKYIKIGMKKERKEFESKANNLWHLLKTYLTSFWD